VRRIESFSDLVIGFSLALLALTLSIPPQISDLITNPWWLIAYFWTFGIICSLWFTHQRLFTHFFWPEPISIIANFVLLSMVGLIVYFVQVFVHYHHELDKVWAFLAYFFAFGIALVALGSLYLHGTRRRWQQLVPDERFTGLKYAVRGIVVGTAIVAGTVVSALFRPTSMDAVWPLVMCVFLGVVGVRIFNRVMKPRIVQAQNA